MANCPWCHNVEHKRPLSAKVKERHAKMAAMSKRTIPPGGDRISREAAKRRRSNPSWGF